MGGSMTNIDTTNRHRPGWRRLLARLCAATAAAAVLASCSSDSDTMSPASQNNETYTVNLTISASSPTTRAAAQLVDGNADENFINIGQSDFAVFIVDNARNTIIQRFLPEDISLVQGRTDAFEYQISGTLRTAREITAIRIMVLANWETFKGGTGESFYDSFAAAAEGKSLAEIYKNATDCIFTMYPAGNEETWQPSEAEQRGIPMVGLSKNPIALGSDQLLNPGETINMLRAIAKVEIIDNTDDDIQGITLSRAGATGRFVPDGTANPEWYILDKQVSAPSLPGTVTDVKNIGFVRKGTVPVDGEEKPLWVAYIPEMHVASTLSGKVRPVFSFTGAFNHDPIRFDNYVNGVQNNSNQLQSVLRNHIYTYKLNGGSDPVEIEYTVLPWELVRDDEPMYFDTPKVAPGGYLKWNIAEGEQGYVDDATTGRLKMKSVTGEFVEGTFTLSAPLNCKWYAQLVHLSDENDAFYFTTGEPIMEDDPSGEKDENGNTVQYIAGFKEGGDSGIIGLGTDGNPKPVTIRIACRNANAVDEKYEARLVVMVEMPDNKQQEVIIVNPPEDAETKYSNYIIWQEEQIQ